MSKEIAKHLDEQIEKIEKRKTALVRLRGEKEVPQEIHDGYIDGLINLSMVEHMFKNSKARFEQTKGEN